MRRASGDPHEKCRRRVTWIPAKAWHSSHCRFWLLPSKQCRGKGETRREHAYPQLPGHISVRIGSAIRDAIVREVSLPRAHGRSFVPNRHAVSAPAACYRFSLNDQNASRSLSHNLRMPHVATHGSRSGIGTYRCIRNSFNGSAHS